MTRPRVIFVAGLAPMEKGHGGQLTAARGLLDSPLSARFELVPISSTMLSIPPPPIAVRVAGAARRLAVFAREIRRADAALIFSADGLALMEKGLMCALARGASCGVVVRLSSGHLVRQVEESAFMNRCLRLTLRSAHVVCSQGPFWTKFFSRYREASGKIVEMRNGIVVPPPPPERSGPCGRLIFAGATDRAKGIFELLEAFRRVRDAHPFVTLTVAGGGRHFDDLQSRIEREDLADAVSLLGWVPHDQMVNLFGAHDVFVLPSHQEGLPNALLEAMAAGLPVVATRVGSIPDAVTHGHDGLLIEVGDVEGLTASIQQLVSDTERTRAMGRSARATVASRYDIEQVWPLFSEALDRAIAESHSPTA